MIKQIIKFGFVGVLCTAIDFICLIIFKEVFNINALIANLLSFAISVLINYSLSMKYVFDSKLDKRYNLIVFVVTSIVGLGINELVIWVLLDYYIVGKLVGTGLSTIFNFISRKLIFERGES
jgi:putative flippase GtrA